MNPLSLAEHGLLLSSALLIVQFLLVLSAFVRRPDLRPLRTTRIPRHLWLPLTAGFGLVYLVLRLIVSEFGPREDPGDAVQIIFIVALALQLASLVLVRKPASSS